MREAEFAFVTPGVSTRATQNQVGLLLLQGSVMHVRDVMMFVIRNVCPIHFCRLVCTSMWAL